MTRRSTMTRTVTIGIRETLGNLSRSILDSLRHSLLVKGIDQWLEGFEITWIKERELPRKHDKVSKERVQMRFHAQMNDVDEVSMVDMRKDAEHLLEDGLAAGEKGGWETSLLADPSLTALSSVRSPNDLGLATSVERIGWASGEDGLVGETVVDPSQNVLDVRSSRKWTWLTVGTQPIVISTWTSRHRLAVSAELKSRSVEEFNILVKLKRVESDPFTLVDVLRQDYNGLEVTLEKM